MARSIITGIESRLMLLISLTVLASLFLPPLVHNALTDKTPPIVAFIRAEAINSPIYAGESLTVRITRKKVRDDCPVVSDRQAISEDGIIFSLPPASHRGGPADEPIVDFAYPTFSSMPPGRYVLRVYLEYTCPGIDIPFAYEQPITPFRIKDKT